MSKSNHQEYLRKIEGECELIRYRKYPDLYEVLRFERYPYSDANIQKIGNLIKDNLNPSLISDDIKKKYPTKHPRWRRSLFGYCVPASFSLLFFMDTDRLHPFTGSDPDGENHWWLEDLDTHQRFDLTSVQYSKTELEFVYGTGKPKRMYGFKGQPQTRFMNLMEMVQPNTKRYIEPVRPSILEDFMK